MKKTLRPKPIKTRISLNNREIVNMIDDIKSMHVAKLSTTAIIYAALKRWQFDLHNPAKNAPKDE